MKVVVVEDEFVHQEQLRIHCEALGWQLLAVVDNAYDALPAVLRQEPDLVLLDIGLKEDTNGVVLAEQLAKLYTGLLLFTTSNTAPEVLQSAAVRQSDGYLIKPVHAEQLKASVHLAQIKRKEQNARKESHSLSLKHATGTDIVPLEEIYSISTSGNRYCRYRCAKRQYRIRVTLAEVETTLPNEQFLRIHKSHLVRVDAIQSLLGAEKVLMKDGEVLPVAESQREALRAALR